MTAPESKDPRRFLIPAAVLALLIVVGGAFVLIGVLRGDDTSTGPGQQPTDQVILPVLTGVAE
ncbi:hypothetical protein [Nocardioides marmotae]|uniref:Uncharacterized protein n=1 Tax=Nocardioides marmotae TaxID=2663857 RepID=A0A6I3JFM5_9ACTN|nr:hypothetical protein [Nocardioides marmotae]MCR6033270.1 hypothetical protein [Gordonia jinghuaiqii]MBC9734779.1 hypothetical protein [Nocardioides marmotae]MTB85880.1 hypothetical protein [Nocardioides marmotae]MTB96927.1 hypothetical protein [Nocardioides marmotae]QKE00688.1 hypothetical protein HPC71_06035 [Nocardioides marmotae]